MFIKIVILVTLSLSIVGFIFFIVEDCLLARFLDEKKTTTIKSCHLSAAFLGLFVFSVIFHPVSIQELIAISSASQTTRSSAELGSMWVLSALTFISIVFWIISHFKAFLNYKDSSSQQLSLAMPMHGKFWLGVPCYLIVLNFTMLLLGMAGGWFFSKLI